MRKQRFLWIFTCIVLLGMFMGCEKEEEASLLHDTLTGVFRTTSIELPAHYGIIDAPIYRDGQFLADILYTDDAQPDPTASYYTDLNRKRISFDEENVTITDVDGTASAFREWTFDDVACSADDMYRLTCTVGGAEVGVIDLPDTFHHTLHIDKTGSAPVDSEFSVLQIVCDTAKNLYVLTNKGVCVIDKSGTLLWVQDTLDDPLALAATEYGVFLLYEFGGQNHFRRLEISDGTLGDEVELPAYIASGNGIGSYGNAVSFYPGDAVYDLFAATEGGLWGLAFAEDENDRLTCTAEEVANWLNSDLDPSAIAQLCVANADLLSIVYVGDDAKELLLLTRVSEEELQSRTVLSLATLSTDDYNSQIIRQAIQAFNKQSTDYRIVVTDFTIYPEESRDTLFQAEIAAGHIPDIVLFSTADGEDPTLYTYQNSGIFTDLQPLMQKDPIFPYDTLLGYVQKPYQTEDGKQYVFPLSPSCTTYFGLPAYFDGPMTAEETFAAIDALPKDARFWRYGAIAIQNDVLASTLRDFVDAENGTCSFAAPAYVDLLDDLCAYDTVPLAGVQLDEIYAKLRDGSLRLVQEDCGNLRLYASLSLQMGVEAVAVGYPNAARKLYIDCRPGVYFAIPDGSAHKEAAIGFLNHYFAAYKSLRKNGVVYSFTEDDVYAEMASYEGQTLVYADGKCRFFDDDALPESDAPRCKLDETYARRFIDFLNAVDAVLPKDSPLYAIVTDEFFSDVPRTSEELAGIIDSRASIYMAERHK